MKHRTFYSLLTLALVIILCSFTVNFGSEAQPETQTRLQDTINKYGDTLAPGKLRLFKKHAHASYYSDKLNGRRTASGKRFDNSKYTAAHRKLPFGTKLKVTNEVNGKFVVVEINDRGPFIKGRELDLSKRAFMDITANKKAGSLTITIEKINP